MPAGELAAMERGFTVFTTGMVYVSASLHHCESNWVSSNQLQGGWKKQVTSWLPQLFLEDAFDYSLKGSYSS